MPVIFSDKLSFSKYSGVKVKCENNVIYCAEYRTAQENFEAIKKALCILYNLPDDILFGMPNGEDKCLFEIRGGTVETYRTY